MKLYSTTTSERASKGQGGNEYLKISVKDENKHEFLDILILPNDEFGLPVVSIEYLDYELLEGISDDINELQDKHLTGKFKQTKGKKQKDEKCNDITCINCDNTMEGLCDNCK